VTFVELIKHVEKSGTPARGDWAATMGRNDCLILWPGLSEALYCSIRRLVGLRLFLHPASLLIYAVDGEVPRLPIARQPHVTTDHFVPVVLCTYSYKRELGGVA
jgi:hypothetical protein